MKEDAMKLSQRPTARVPKTEKTSDACSWCGFALPPEDEGCCAVCGRTDPKVHAAHTVRRVKFAGEGAANVSPIRHKRFVMPA